MGDTVSDPICGKEVDPLRARAVGIFGGITYYFCSPECKAQFADPRQTVQPVAVERRRLDRTATAKVPTVQRAEPTAPSALLPADGTAATAGGAPRWWLALVVLALVGGTLLFFGLR